jgi:hypothetical protein
MDEGEHIRDAQAVQALFGQLDQRLGPLTHEGQHPDSQRLETGLNQGVPGGIGAILCDLFEHQVATDKVHEHEHQAL